MSHWLTTVQSTFILVGLTLTIACAGDSASVDTAATTSSVSGTTGETADPCDGVPLVNWDTFGSAFMTHECQVCHGSGVVERFGAPEEVIFDTVEEVWARAERILARATGEKSTMPPNGGTFEDDQTKLEWWLKCAPYGT